MGEWSFPKTERNEEWVRLHTEEGLTLTEIGDRYGVTRERVRQVVRKLGVPQWVTQEVLRVAIREAALVDWECDVCGTRERRTATRARIKTCGSEECVGVAMSEGQRVYTDAGLLEWLRELAEHLGHTPSQRDINAHGPPSHMPYHRRFGSMRRAQALAGLEPNENGGGYTKPYEPEPVATET